MAKRKNITSPIRSGFDYQDFWALKLCGEWLLNPGKFKWMQIEANPTEDQAFYLDDIVLLDNQNLYHLHQAKFKTDNQYQWDWDDFLKKRKGKNGELPSLFRKWAISFRNVGEENIGKVALVTNGNVSNDLKEHLTNQRIDIYKIKTANPDLYELIKNEIGDDEFIETFCSKFEIIFQNLNINHVENEIEEFFNDKLNVTKAGFDSLYRTLKRKAREPYTIKLTLDQIKEWCEFDNPRPLNEKFEVPSDFQFFDEATHENIIQDLQNPDGGMKVIYGKPGTGKSVYLSWLAEDLKEKNVVIIKHHYHINPADNSSFERLNTERIIEAIKAQFKSRDYKEYLGELANKNSREIPLRDFITSVAKNLFKDSKNFVIIIDGLDHVVRERGVCKLKDFLDEVFYPQKGLWIIFGMQPQIKNEPIFQPIFGKCSQKYWIEIQGLKGNAVFDLVKKNITALNLSDDQNIFKALVNKLYEITEGNPLHLRYTLIQLKNHLDNRLVTEYECRDLIPYGKNIEKYYESLWNTLEEEIKSFLLTFISVDFQFTRQQFIECISSFNGSSTTVSQSFKKVEHLIAYNLREKIRIYHNSFRIFLNEQKEWEEQKQIIKKKVKEWIENSQYENLKWAELRKLEYELGSDDPILEIGREWLIDTISHPRNPSQIESQLELCSRAAFNKNDFAKSLKISHLHTYYKNAQDFVEEAARLILIESVKANPDFICELILSELASDVLVVVADIANQSGKAYLIDEIIEILQERLDHQEYRTGQIPLATEAIIKVIPYDRTHKAKRIHKYTIQFRDLEISSLLFKFYVEGLLFLDQRTKINELLEFDLIEDERKAILESCIRHDLKQRASEFTKIIEKKSNNSFLEQVYLILQGKNLSVLLELPNYDDFPFTIPEYAAEREKWAIKFYKFFFIGIIYGLSGKQEKIEEWISTSPSPWSAQATTALFISALNIANTIQKENKIYYEDIFNELKTLSDLKWPEDRDRLEFKFALKNALTNILELIVFIKCFLNDSTIIDEKNYKKITSTPFFLQNDVFELVLDLGQPILEKNVYDIILSKKTTSLKNTVNYFPDRSEEYAKLSNLSKLYQNNEAAKDLLAKAVNNFLGYGYRKDTYLFDVLEAIEICAEAGIGSQKKEDWIQRIIPLITNVGEYTDGAETNHLPNYLADFLSKDNKNLLFKFYFDQANKEELYPAQELFKYVIRSLDFVKDIEMHLATTALDKGSIEELREKAKISIGAQTSVGIIREYLGKVIYKDEDYRSSPDFKEEKINYAEVKPEKLEEYLGKLETKWDFERYAIGWIKHWLEQEDKQKIYNLIKSIVFKNNNIQSISGDILDILYPLAYEFENSEAFRFLCFAQANDHGWARYFTRKEKAERRWDFVKEKYPYRYLEFFKSSTNYGVPLSRGVEFFIRFGDLDNAAAITEASVDFTENLMANLNLRSPDWTKVNFQEVDELDLLFQRLLWPSPLVRERAATAIGDLLANSPKKEEICKRLLDWISNWKIESIIAIGLLPITKAFQVCKKKSDVAFIKADNISNSIKASSLVIEKLILEIASGKKEELNEFPNYISSRQLPDFYEPDDFFIKYIRTILAPIYDDRAQKIEKETSKPFIKLWAYNAEAIAKESNIELKSNHYFYGHLEHDKFLTGFSTKVSEVYRSAFLRVLHDFHNDGLIPLDFYLEYALATLPIDLSFWSILPNRAPEWWPKLVNPKTDNEEKKISLIQLKEPIENSIQFKKNNKIILSAEGSIEPAEGWIENPTHSFSLIGFGYKVHGANLPEAEEVTKKILYSPQTLLIPTKADCPVSFLKNSVHFNIHCDSIQFKDLIVYPLVTRNRDLTIGLWQYFRDKNPSFNINEKIREGLGCVINNNKWLYENKDNDEVVVFKDWIEGLQERYEFKMPIPHGHYVLIDEKFVTEALKDNELRLGYVLKTTFRSKEYGHDKVQKINDFTLLNISRIIIN